MTVSKVTVLAGVIGILGLSHAAAEEPLESQILAALDQAFGLHQGFRPNHAKGVVIEGRFKANPQAAALSKAKPFDGSAMPVTARFSDATGIPDLPDGSPFANPHGMAVKFKQPDGSESDMVLVSLKTFPVSARISATCSWRSPKARPMRRSRPSSTVFLPPIGRRFRLLPVPPRRTASPMRSIVA